MTTGKPGSTGNVLTRREAQESVAQDRRNLAYFIHRTDTYGPNVTQEQKNAVLAESLAAADRLEQGEVGSLSAEKEIQDRMTGVIQPLLPF